MSQPHARSNNGPAAPARFVVVLYENASAREQASRFCERMAEHRDAPLQVSWWSLSFLSQPAMAHDAAEKALAAELIVFAMSGGGDLPHDAKIWVESWLGRRHGHEGAIVGLVENANPGEIASLKEIYLRHIAHRAGMDYLSHSTPTAAKAMPDSIESYNARAGHMTSVLAEILRVQPPTAPLL